MWLKMFFKDRQKVGFISQKTNIAKILEHFKMKNVAKIIGRRE